MTKMADPNNILTSKVLVKSNYKTQQSTMNIIVCLVNDQCVKSVYKKFELLLRQNYKRIIEQ